MLSSFSPRPPHFLSCITIRSFPRVMPHVVVYSLMVISTSWILIECAFVDDRRPGLSLRQDRI